MGSGSVGPATIDSFGFRLVRVSNGAVLVNYELNRSGTTVSGVTQTASSQAAIEAACGSGTNPANEGCIVSGTISAPGTSWSTAEAELRIVNRATGGGPGRRQHSVQELTISQVSGRSAVRETFGGYEYYDFSPPGVMMGDFPVASRTYSGSPFNVGVLVSSNPFGASAFDTSTLSEMVVSNFSSSNGTITGISGPFSSPPPGVSVYNLSIAVGYYVLEVTPATLGGQIRIDFTGTLSDMAGNDSNPTWQLYNYVPDTTPPTPVVTSGTSSFTDSSPITVTVTFDENVAGFDPMTVAADLNISGGTLTGVGTNTGPRTFDFEITPNAGSIADISITTPANAAQDTAGNNSLVSNTLTLTDNRDFVDPVPTVTSTVTEFTDGSPVLVTVTFDEDVVDFDPTTVPGDLNVSGGTLTGVGTNTGPRTFDLLITPTPNSTDDITVSVPVDVAQDLSGNDNVPSNLLTLTNNTDNDGPVPVVTSSVPQYDGTTPFEVTVDIGEPLSPTDTFDPLTISSLSTERRAHSSTTASALTPSRSRQRGQETSTFPCPKM